MKNKLKFPAALTFVFFLLIPILVWVGTDEDSFVQITEAFQNKDYEADVIAVEEKALRLPPHILAYVFLTTFYDNLWLQGVHAEYEIMEKAVKGYKVIVTSHTPDGKEQQFTLKTFEELNQFIAKNHLRHTAYEKAIMKRGFKQFSLKYDVKLSPDCGDRWFSSGEVVVQQNGFMLDISQPGKVFSGISVEDTVTVIRAPTSKPMLVGGYGKNIHLQDVNSKCKITLNKIIDTVNKEKLYTGKHVTYWDIKEKQKKEEITYKDGKKDGLFTAWYRNGQKMMEEHFKDNKLEGHLTTWYENGQKKLDVYYKNGKRDGLLLEWYDNGRKKSEGNLKKDKKHGLLTFWYENGQKLAEENYKDGKRDGPFTSWYKNGQKQTEENYKEGSLID